MTKKKRQAVTVSVSTTSVVATGDVTSSADAAALLAASAADATATGGATGTATISIDGRRLCSQCDTWKPLESYDKWSRICRTCWAAALR